MSSKLEITRHMLEYAYQTMKGHFSKLSLEEAVFVPQGGFRSILGTLKHAAGWSHVYRSYAFDPQPKHWAQLDWPFGLRDTIIKSEPYLQDIIAWFDEAHRRWLTNLAQIQEDQLDDLRPLHWGSARRSRGSKTSAPYRLRLLILRLHENWEKYTLDQRRGDVPATNNATERAIGKWRIRSRSTRGFKSWEGLEGPSCCAGVSALREERQAREASVCNYFSKFTHQESDIVQTL